MAIRWTSWNPEIQLKPSGSRATVRFCSALGGIFVSLKCFFIYQDIASKVKVLWREINSHLSHLSLRTTDLMRGCDCRGLGQLLENWLFLWWGSWQSSAANQCTEEKGAACSVTWKHFRKGFQTNKERLKHQREHVNTHMTGTTPCESCVTGRDLVSL